MQLNCISVMTFIHCLKRGGIAIRISRIKTGHKFNTKL